MYVAVTRARKRLYLSHAQTRMLHGQTRYSLPSFFLEELPANLLHKINRAPTYTAMASPRASSAPYIDEQGSANALRIGQNVQHAKFGLGVIVTAEGRGEEARVQVNFGAHGMKWLALQYAKLTPV